MSAKPNHDRDYFLTRIARALGCAGYSPEECEAILAWVQEAHPASVPSGNRCAACGGAGRVAYASDGEVPVSAEESMSGLSERTAMLLQGICLACRGRGRT